MYAGLRQKVSENPVASILCAFLSMAITDGSFSTIPFPFKVTKVLAVPKSIPMSFDLANKFIKIPPLEPLCSILNNIFTARVAAMLLHFVFLI